MTLERATQVGQLARRAPAFALDVVVFFYVLPLLVALPLMTLVLFGGDAIGLDHTLSKVLSIAVGGFVLVRVAIPLYTWRRGSMCGTEHDLADLPRELRKVFDVVLTAIRRGEPS